MNDEEMKCEREKYWSEIDIEEKINRTRRAVKHLQADVSMLMKFMRLFQSHSHTPDGSVVIPMFMKDEPCLDNRRYMNTANGDDVYF